MRACGSPLSLIQPCSTHSRITPSSRRTRIAHPWSEGTRSRLVVSIENESAESRFVQLKDSDSRSICLCSRRSLFVGVGGMASQPRDLADRMAGQRTKAPDGFVRETFSLPREQARARAKAFLKSYPSAAYMSEVNCLQSSNTSQRIDDDKGQSCLRWTWLWQDPRLWITCNT